MIKRLVENGGTQHPVGAERHWRPKVVHATHWLLAVMRHIDLAHHFQLQLRRIMFSLTGRSQTKNQKYISSGSNISSIHAEQKNSSSGNETSSSHAGAIRVWTLIRFAHLLGGDCDRLCHHHPRDALLAGRRRERSGVRIIVVLVHCVRASVRLLVNNQSVKNKLLHGAVQTCMYVNV